MAEESKIAKALIMLPKPEKTQAASSPKETPVPMEKLIDGEKHSSKPHGLKVDTTTSKNVHKWKEIRIKGKGPAGRSHCIAAVNNDVYF